jgi:hypothetical protein
MNVYPWEALRRVVGDLAWRDPRWRLVDEPFRRGPTPMHRFVVLRAEVEVARAEEVTMEAAARACLGRLRTATPPRSGPPPPPT